jgi:hypothetical protein
LLLGSIKPIVELQRGRKRKKQAGDFEFDGNDADSLHQQTFIPGFFWVVLFFIISIASNVAGLTVFIYQIVS